MKIKLQFGEYDCVLRKAEYTNGRAALALFDEVTGEPILTASVNIPEFDLRSTQVLIKNWSENEGVLQSLIDNNVVTDTGEVVHAGFVEANLCYLRPEDEWAK